jgi:hypothetical protein
MNLALRMAERLKNDPIGSQMTERGRQQLKRLSPRWISGVSTVQTSVEGLAGAIEKAFGDAGNKTRGEVVKRVFDGKVQPRFKELNPKDFQAELLVLQRKAPSKRKDKHADRKEKKKYREQGLTKVRKYKRLVMKDPVYQSLLFETNPWAKKDKKARVDGLPLMRALNDLELNLSRGIY